VTEALRDRGWTGTEELAAALESHGANRPTGLTPLVMERFISTVCNPDLAGRLTEAISRSGAFGTFDLLERYPRGIHPMASMSR
jgi:hypothetical protein